MFEGVRNPLLRLMRVPPEPETPQGSPESIKVFRAGRNFYLWSLVRWALVQFCVGFALLIVLTAMSMAGQASQTPYVVRYAIGLVGWLAFFAFVTQLAVSFFVLRLNYEMRWYIVTDRSLRIRFGIVWLEEMTMTFANIQQINIKQGPLQRVLGIANLEVTSAGGGAHAASEHSGGRSSHTGRFDGVDNAEAIRDLILERLKHYRDSGLGDPDDQHAHVLEHDSVQAAEELLGEARELRRVVARLS